MLLPQVDCALEHTLTPEAWVRVQGLLHDLQAVMCPGLDTSAVPTRRAMETLKFFLAQNLSVIAYCDGIPDDEVEAYLDTVMRDIRDLAFLLYVDLRNFGLPMDSPDDYL